MPYKSEAQRRLMQAVAHSPEFARKVGIPQSVGRKFEEHKRDPKHELAKTLVARKHKG